MKTEQNSKGVKAASLHTSVSNLPSETFEPLPKGKKLVNLPTEGPRPQPIIPSSGIEKVTGFKLREVTTEMLAEAFTAPDTSKLRDIGEASFGPPPPRAESVHGPEDRVRINNTSVYPWSAHASLLITANDNSLWVGTGWFIGKHTLMTAGHVVFIKNSGVPNRDGWVKRIEVMPGRNVNQLPFGKITSSNFRSVTGWTNSGDQNFDYGAIIISQDLGNSTGWFGFGVYSDAELTGCTGNISGYPADKPSGTQWYDAHKINSVNSRKVYYDIDTFGGQSGSAVYRIINGGRYGIAIHCYGGASLNSGTRIVTAVYNNMIAWKA